MRRGLKHLQANVVAYMALFVALSGTSYAAASLPANSVGTRQLRNGSVTGRKVAARSLTNGNLAQSTVRLSPGDGLTGGGSIPLGGTSTLNVNPSVVQHRITGDCPSRSAISSVAGDGSVTCDSDATTVDGETITKVFFASPAITYTGPASTRGTVVFDGDDHTLKALCPNPSPINVALDAQSTDPDAQLTYEGAEGGTTFSGNLNFVLEPDLIPDAGGTTTQGAETVAYANSAGQAVTASLGFAQGNGQFGSSENNCAIWGTITSSS